MRGGSMHCHRRMGAYGEDSTLLNTDSESAFADGRLIHTCRMYRARRSSLGNPWVTTGRLPPHTILNLPKLMMLNSRHKYCNTQLLQSTHVPIQRNA